MLRSIVLLCALLASILFGYRNCNTQQFSRDPSSFSLFEFTPKCIGDDNTVTLKIDPVAVDNILLKCKRIEPIIDTDFLSCDEIALDNDGANTLISVDNIVFTNLTNDFYELSIRTFQLIDEKEQIDDHNVSIERCVTETTETTTTTDNTEGVTCDTKRGGDSCKVCDNPNSLTEMPRDRTCPPAQSCVGGVCKNTECPTCLGCQVCNTTTKQCEDHNISCSGDCNICNNGVCNGATTCEAKKVGDTCKVCDDPNSCTEEPRAVSITCGSGAMYQYKYDESNKPTCPTSQKTLCGVTCYGGGGLTCEQRRSENSCTECKTVCGFPTNKTITCGIDNGSVGDAKSYPSTAMPTCVAAQKTFCGTTTCYRPARTCNQKLADKPKSQCWMCEDTCGDPVLNPDSPDICKSL